VGNRENAAVAEWRENWTLPIAAMVGYSATAIHIYSLGAFIQPLEQEFGWSRSQITLGLTVASLIGAAFSVVVGLLVDRMGSRMLGLSGIVATTAAFALFGYATGSMFNWIGLWVVMGLAALLMQPTVWTKPVAARFEQSRGLALAVTLAGTGIAAAVFPLLANALVQWLGWRLAFPALGAFWAVLVLPVAYFFFRTEQVAPLRRVHRAETGQSAGATAVAEVPGLTVPQALRDVAYYKLLIASLLFILTILGIVVHFVPILTEHGASPLRAAAKASLIGVSAIVGRLAAGLLIDRFPAHRVGAAIFMLPVVASLLLTINGPSPIVQATAAICFGLTLGAEIDVIAYLVTRYMGLRNYGVLFGAITGALAIGGAVGPLSASVIRDMWGSYEPFLMIAAVCAGGSSLAIATLGPPRFASRH